MAIPDLGLHGILAGAGRKLDAQMLLDPLEEQFDLPAAFVKGAMVNAGGEVVGQEAPASCPSAGRDMRCAQWLGINVERTIGPATMVWSHASRSSCRPDRIAARAISRLPRVTKKAKAAEAIGDTGAEIE